MRRAGMRPSNLTQSEWEYATQMLFELEMSEGLRVCLIPSDGDSRNKIRAVESGNPRWYSEFSAQHQRTHMRRDRRTGKMRPSKNQTRNHHTFIDRRIAMSALKRIVHDRLIVGEYGERLVLYVKQKCETGEPYIFEPDCPF
jgi:hypothetical protein